MKILHLAPERDSAQVAARAVRGLAQNVTLTWARTAASALQSLQGHRDTAAVIVEVQAQSCAGFVDQLRALDLTTPIVAVTESRRLEGALDAFKAGVDGYVVAGPTIEQDLRQAVAAAIDRDRRRRGHLTQALIELDAERDRVRQHVARAEEARRQADERRACEVAAIESRLAGVESEHGRSLARANRIGAALQERLFELEAAEQEANRRHAAERADLRMRYEGAHEERAAFERHAAAVRSALEQAIRERDEEAAARGALERTVTEAQSAAERIATRAAADLDAAASTIQALQADLAEAATGRTALAAAVAAANTAHDDTRERAARERAAANERQAALELQLHEEQDANGRLRQAFDQLQADARALDETAHARADECARLATLAAERDDQLRAESDRHRAVEADSRAAMAELEANLAETAAAGTALTEALAEAHAAHEDTRELASRARAAENERQAMLEERLVMIEAAGQEATRRHAAQISDLQSRCDAVLDERAAFEQRAGEDLAAAAARQAALEQQLSEEQNANGRLRQTIEQLQADVRALDETTHAQADEGARLAALAAERDQQLRAEADRHRAVEADSRAAMAELEANLAETSAGRTALADALAEANAAHEDTRELASRERTAATERQAMLEGQLVVVEAAGQEATRRHAAQLSDLQARYDAARDERAAFEQRAAEDHAFAAARQRTLEDQLDAERARLATLVAERDQLGEQADRHRAAEEQGRAALADVRTQLERSRHERRRLFERAPYAWCRCSPEGAILEANHTFVALFGVRRDHDLRDMNLVAASQNRTGDLRWLLERARTTGKTETVETEWTIRDGRRLIVRLQALAAADAIDIVAEDITGVRALQDQLRQARRMEAVGRVASEVAMTCDALLSDVARSAHEWLAGAGRDEALHRYIERLLIDLTRAAGFLRQLEMYGREQVRALEPVSARRVLRNLAPVLSRIVGDQIALVLPKAGGSFDVDIDAERLERVFINVAGYARQRMSAGGQVSIDLATTAVGRRFAARYSNVRPGDHVLITVTELPAAGGADAVAHPRARPDHPGVDVGVLVDLIASCGGHLWLEARPAGNMVLKIHLPKPAVQAAAPRARLLSKWIRTMPAAGVRA